MIARNPLLNELVKRHAVPSWDDRIAGLERDCAHQRVTIARLMAELNAAKAGARGALLEVRLFCAKQAKERPCIDLEHASLMQDQAGEEEAA